MPAFMVFFFGSFFPILLFLLLINVGSRVDSGVVIFLAFVLPVLLLFVWVPAGAVVGSSGLFFNFPDFDLPVLLLLPLE